MKNIHLLPTPNQSRLIINASGVLTLGKEFYTILENKQNIYITSDEEIKEGDWVVFNELEIVKCTYSKNGEFLFSEPLTSSSNHHFSYFKKIILTTDQDLIAEGIQQIDDEFLEWFVKNPSCEEVEVERKKCETLAVCDCKTIGGDYKIIIPKEEPKQVISVRLENSLKQFNLTLEEALNIEQSKLKQIGFGTKSIIELQNLKPKQETLVRDYSNRSCQTCNLFNSNNDGEGVCELELENECASYSNDETLEDFWISCLDDESDSVLYKQETLEEAIGDWIDANCDRQDGLETLNDAIKFGYKLSQEQNKNLYSEKQMDDAYDKGFKDAIEKMYSEEDLKCAWDSSDKNMRFQFSSSAYKGVTFKQWLDKFKNK